ncbi:hypothetical protein [Intestinibacter bartlettii]|uniref:DNA-directed RNA polymerase subunit P n=1 Tax=Intestinibacter bartlettii TaxID=261299 RepID=A0ABS6DYT4_9FIRM|nr:hypothetical protein [Intestinibacter bartlettii]MBU5336997.1 hypothetical protein [Intestinibacter bartlettii]MDO5009435.1 hypothetical protein [Intestinibacter bartlettii]
MDTAKTYYCQNCGAVMEFDACSQNLKCPSCGNEIKIEHDESKVIEHKLTRHAMNSIKAEEKQSTSMECEGCGALVEVDATSTATTCPYCGSNYVLAKKQTDALIPDGVVPFRINKIETGEIYHKWIKSRWLAPNELKSLYQADKVQGIYIPFWTFDADVHASYNAMGGEDYEVTYKDDDGKMHTEIRTRWHHTSGHVHKFFDDVLVRASDKLKPNLLNSLIYNTQNVSSFSPDYMSGYCAEVYTIDLEDAHKEAINKMQCEMRHLCERDVLRRYDRVSNLNMNANYDKETYKHILVPIYSSAYYYKGREYHILINGQSGVISGEYPKSIFKIAAIVVVIIIIIVLAVYYVNS